MSSKRILVAEDDRAFAGIIRHILETEGCTVDVAGNGRIAFEMLSREPYDMLVTDYQMPELSGGELCRLVREDPNHRELPIILISAKGLELDLTFLREQLAVCAVFHKPFSPRELRKTVSRQLAAREAAVPQNGGTPNLAASGAEN